MFMTSENNKRIARNTLFLYFRQILIMAVSLYTVRVWARRIMVSIMSWAVSWRCLTSFRGRCP